MDDLSYEVPEVKATEKFYRRSRWWISHRERLKRIGLGVWIALDLFLVAFALWVFVDTFLIRYESERGLLRSMLVENPNTLYANSQAPFSPHPPPHFCPRTPFFFFFSLSSFT